MRGEDKFQWRSKLWSKPEGHILAAGMGVVLVYIVWVCLGWYISAEYGRNILSLTAVRFAVGRPGGVYFGHMVTIDYGTNIGINLMIDALATFFLYPLFVFGLKNIFVFRRLKKVIEGIHKTAQANYNVIKTYGIPGLILFVLFPLWGTGPVVGSAIGFMMGLRPWVSVGIALGSTFLAIVLWVFILAEFHVKLLSYSAYLPLVVVGVFFTIAIGIHLVRGMKRKKRGSKLGHSERSEESHH